MITIAKQIYPRGVILAAISGTGFFVPGFILVMFIGNSAFGLDLHHEIKGQGNPIVLIPGLLTDISVFDHQIATLSKSFKTIAFDLPGHGQTPLSEPNRCWELTDVTASIVRTLDQLDIKQAHWIGFSLGGMIAIRAAIDRPDWVKTLTIISSTPASETEGNKKRNLELVRQVQERGMISILPILHPLFFSETTLKNRSSLVEIWSQKFVQVTPQAVNQGVRALNARKDAGQEFSGLKIPVLIIRAENDPTAPPGHGQSELRPPEGISKSDFDDYTVPSAGHFCLVEQPETVSRRILQFLDQHR